MSFHVHMLAFDRREPVAVLAAGALGAALLVSAPPTPLTHAAPACFLTAMLLWIAATDLRRWIIPDGAVIAVGIVGTALRLAPGASGLAPAPLDILPVALDGLAWAGALFALREIYFRRRGFDGLGFGDVKLAGAGGLLLGMEGFAWALLLASLAGLVAALAVRVRGKTIEKVPFGAFLAPACGAVWLFRLLG